LEVYVINCITKSYILNIKIRLLVTEYSLRIKLVGGTSSDHSFNPYAYFGHSWSYFDIQNLRLVILYLVNNSNNHNNIFVTYNSQSSWQHDNESWWNHRCFEQKITFWQEKYLWSLWYCFPNPPKCEKRDHFWQFIWFHICLNKPKVVLIIFYHK